jgi:hypothetical protein
MAPGGGGAYLRAMGYEIAYFGPLDRVPEFEEVETEFDVLADAIAQATRDVAAGGRYDWARGYSVRDWTIFERDPDACDPQVASWWRERDA